MSTSWPWAFQKMTNGNEISWSFSTAVNKNKSVRALCSCYDSRSEQWIADLPAKQVGGSNMRYQPVQYVAPLDNQSWVYMFVKEGQTLWFGQTDLWQGGGVSKSYFIIPTLVQHNANANLIWFDLIQVIWDGGVFRNASKKLKAGICTAPSLKLT